MRTVFDLHVSATFFTDYIRYFVLVDAVSRKYFTSETSWLWDIDFDQLNAPQVQRIILSGRYCNDLAERFSFTDIPREKVTVQADIPAAAAELTTNG